MMLLPQLEYTLVSVCNIKVNDEAHTIKSSCEVLLYGGRKNDHSDITCLTSGHSIKGFSISSPEPMFISVRGIRKRISSITYFSLNALTGGLVSTSYVQFNLGGTRTQREHTYSAERGEHPQMQMRH
jgi:hypothetical protein